MPETRSHEELINEIRKMPAAIETAVRDLDNVHLDTPYGEGKWSVRQVVHHLADAHCNALARMKWILTEDIPTIKPYDQDHWAELADMQMAVEPSLSILRGVHERIGCMLQSLPEESWQRRAHHPEVGEISLHDLVGIIARHGRTHFEQIMSLRTSRGW
jgi:hypothetical protein